MLGEEPIPLPAPQVVGGEEIRCYAHLGVQGKDSTPPVGHLERGDCHAQVAKVTVMKVPVTGVTLPRLPVTMRVASSWERESGCERRATARMPNSPTTAGE